MTFYDTKMAVGAIFGKATAKVDIVCDTYSVADEIREEARDAIMTAFAETINAIDKTESKRSG